MIKLVKLIRLFSIFHVLLCCLLGSDHEYPKSWDTLQNNVGWKLIKIVGRVKIFSKEINVSPLPAFRAEMISDVDLNKLADVAWLVEKSTDIFPNAYITDAGVYHERSDTSYTAFQIFDIPFLAPRLYQFNSIRIGSSIHWVRTDTVNLSFNPDKFMLPPVNFGSWEIQASGNQSKIIYRVCTDPGGNVPLWIVEQANQRYLPLMLKDMENYARNH